MAVLNIVELATFFLPIINCMYSYKIIFITSFSLVSALYMAYMMGAVQFWFAFFRLYDHLLIDSFGVLA